MKEFIKLSLFFALLTSVLLAADKKDSWKETLYKAITSNDKTAVEKLLAEGADVEATLEDGKTPLMVAVQAGSKEITRLILAKNPNLSAYDRKGKVALHYCQTEEMARLLLPGYIKDLSINDYGPRYRNQNLAIYAANNGYDLKLIKYYVEQGIDVKETGAVGMTLLHNLADRIDALDVIDLVLKKGADINALNQNNETPLFKALQNNARMNNIKFLIEKGADVKTASVDGTTPLHLAAQSKSLESIKLLVSKGADILAKNKNNATPFGISCERGDNEAVLFYLSRLPKITVKDPAMANALINSIGQTKITDTLLASGFNINMKDAEGNTALHKVANSGDYFLVESVLNRGADVNARNNNGDTPLHLVTTTEYQFVRDIAELLISRGANQDIKNQTGITPRKKIAEILKLASNAEKLLRDTPVKNGKIQAMGMEIPIPPGVESVRCSINQSQCIYSFDIATDFEKEVKTLNTFYTGKFIGTFQFGEFKQNPTGYGWNGGTRTKGVSINISQWGNTLMIWVYPKKLFD